MRLRNVGKLAGLALLGLVLATVIGILANAVASDSIGLSAKPTVTSAHLAPSDAAKPDASGRRANQDSGDDEANGRETKAERGDEHETDDD